MKLSLIEDAIVIRPDQRRRYDLLVRAIRSLAQHGMPLVTMSRLDGGNDFEIAGVPVREIDVIVRAAMLDRSLFAGFSTAPANDDQRAA